MNFISFLSTQIEKGAIFLNELIIVILPFMEPYLLDHPEAIMITICLLYTSPSPRDRG